MGNESGLGRQILTVFLLLSLGISVAMGLVAYFGALALGEYLVSRQVTPVMETLIETEIQNLHARDKRRQDVMESGELARLLGWQFLVGKEIPAQLTNLPNGLTFRKDDFILKEERAGVKYVLVSASGSFAALKARLGLTLAICGLLAVVLALLAGMRLYASIARPLRKLAREVRGLDCESREVSGQLLPDALLARRDETGVLARALEDREKRLREYLYRETCFSGDVSHELRTPLTVLRGGLEVLASRGTPPNNDTALLGRLLAVVDEMSSIVAALLSLSRPPHDPALVCLDISELAREAASERQTSQNTPLRVNNNHFAHDHTYVQSGLDATIMPGVVTPGNKELAKIVMRNLIENALRYTEDGRAFFCLRKGFMEIRNRGAIPAALDIFGRGIQGKEGKGYGLGLTLAARACEMMKWRLVNCGTDSESIFRVYF